MESPSFPLRLESLVQDVDAITSLCESQFIRPVSSDLGRFVFRSIFVQQGPLTVETFASCWSIMRGMVLEFDAAEMERRPKNTFAVHGGKSVAVDARGLRPTDTSRFVVAVVALTVSADVICESDAEHALSNLWWNEIAAFLAEQSAAASEGQAWVRVQLAAVFQWIEKVADQEMPSLSPPAKQKWTKWLQSLYAIYEGDETCVVGIASAALCLHCDSMFEETSVCAAFVHLLNSRFYEFGSFAIPALVQGRVKPAHFYPSDVRVLLTDVLPRYENDDSPFSLRWAGAPASWADSGSEVPLSRVVKETKLALWSGLAPDEEGSTKDVTEWFASLPLSKDYAAVIEQGAVDGEVLWSDLGRKDLFEMGIDEFDDVELLLQILERRT